MSDAALFYESRVVGLGQQFSAEIQRIVAFIRECPDAGAAIRLPQRKVLAERFPYAVVYRRMGESVHIIAVAHPRKRPGYWRHRK